LHLRNKLEIILYFKPQLVSRHSIDRLQRHRSFNRLSNDDGFDIGTEFGEIFALSRAKPFQTHRRQGSARREVIRPDSYTDETEQSSTRNGRTIDYLRSLPRCREQSAKAPDFAKKRQIDPNPEAAS
jgi:hypothetical protein